MKRAFLMCLILLALAVAVSGTVAFFTDTITGQGQAVSGELSILQHEYERARTDAGTYTDTIRPYTQQQMIYPCVVSASAAHTHTVTVDGHTVQLMDQSLRNFVDKIVTVENIGKNVAYVRTFVAIPAHYDGEASINWIHLDKNTADGWVWADEPIRNVTVDGVCYDIHYATNTNQLVPGETTAPCLLGFYLDSNVSQSGQDYTYTTAAGKVVNLGPDAALNILVATEASQAIVFEAEGSKPAAFVAMDATYKAPSPIRNPWVDVQIVSTQADMESLLNNAAYNTCIGLKDGTYTLPAQLPNGVRIFAMGMNVRLTAAGNAFSAYDVEIDGVTFTAPVTFTGHGSFQEVTFLQGWSAAPTTGDILFDHCAYNASAVLSGGYTVSAADCTNLSGVAYTD